MTRRASTPLRRGLTATTMLTALAAALPAHAQQDDAPDLIQSGANAEAEATRDEIVVTGSRLRRSGFDSISPLQVIDADASRLSGLTTASEFITQSPVVTGAQLDNSVNAGSPTAAVEGVSAGGVGANNISLRGLGPERTLLLLNGRRLAPSGVRGAPIAPDLNLVPGLAVETVEILTDGASSIYGSDAVAGVANIILRQDFDGFEVSGQVSEPFEQGGDVRQVGFIAGATGERGNVTFSGEFYDRDTVFVGQRGDFNDCLRDIEVADNGEVFSACLDPRPDNSVFLFSEGFVFRTPGFTSEDLPTGFSRQADLEARGVNFRLTDTYTLQDEERDTQLLGGVERYNLFTSGEYEVAENATFYFEAGYARRETTDFLTNEQIFPGVHAFIPQEAFVDAVDGDGNPIPQLDGDGDPVTDDAGNPVFIQQLITVTDTDGRPVLVDNPLNPFGEAALPVYTSNSLPQIRDADVSNLRLVGGFTGDIAALADKGWIYDVGLTYDRSYGTATQPILREDAIRTTLDTLRVGPDGELVCGLPRTAPSFGFLTPEPCTVVDFFADSNFSVTGGSGDFATQAERDYLRGRAFNTTEIEQRQVYGLFTGDVVDMPAGTVGLALGIEYRELEITSRNDVVRENGLAASEVPDIESDTIGETYLFEVFAETELPLHETFDLNLSGRYTEEKNFGEEFTYSVKGKFDPTDWLGVRGTYGTTFRAPNLREQFLSGQAGTVSGLLDPCRVPTDAIEGGAYVPENDTRDPAVLAQCRTDGADPTTLGLQATTGIPTLTGGSEALEAETSDSWTAGVIFDAGALTDAFELDLAVTYFDIEIQDTVRESSAGNILGSCYSVNPDPVACSRITRNPSSGTVSLVDASFINIGSFETSGIDYVARFGMGLDGIGSAFEDTDLGLSFTASQTLKTTEDISPDDDDVDRLDGTVGLPEWRWLATATVEKGPFTALWRTSYIGKGDAVEPSTFDDREADPFGGSACAVLGYTGQCRDLDFVGDYATHDASLTFEDDVWTLTAGVRNVFDEEPPLIDQSAGNARANIAVQSGYDLIGRRAFVNLSRRF